MKVLITPNPMLNSGTCQRTLGEIGVGPVLEKDGKIRCEMTEAQLALFQLRGASHRVDVIPEVAAELIPESLPVQEEPKEEPQPVIVIESTGGVRKTVTLPIDPHAPVAGSQEPVHGSQTAVRGSEPQKS
jgi:hypothetical protein